MNTELRELILKLIEKNSRLAIHDLAVMLDVAETEVANEIADMEKEHIICGYHTLINWDNTSKDQLTAMIEVKVTPQRGQGFDRIAERIYNFPEVKAVYLMSGVPICSSVKWIIRRYRNASQKPVGINNPLIYPQYSLSFKEFL